MTLMTFFKKIEKNKKKIKKITKRIKNKGQGALGH
jgi:hypothetical protein